MYSILAILIYILGCVIFCLLNHSLIGTTEYDLEGWDYELDATDVVLKSVFWPIFFIVCIIFLPINIGARLLDKYHYGKNI